MINGKDYQITSYNLGYKTEFELKIDKLVYKIYGLSEEDCSIIEESFKQVVLQ